MCIVGNIRKAGDLWIKSTRTTVSLKKTKKTSRAGNGLVHQNTFQNKSQKEGRGRDSSFTLQDISHVEDCLFFCNMTVCSVLMGFTKKQKKTKKHCEGNSQDSIIQSSIYNQESKIKKSSNSDEMFQPLPSNLITSQIHNKKRSHNEHFL